MTNEWAVWRYPHLRRLVRGQMKRLKFSADEAAARSGLSRNTFINVGKQLPQEKTLQGFERLNISRRTLDQSLARDLDPMSFDPEVMVLAIEVQNLPAEERRVVFEVVNAVMRRHTTES